VAFGTSAYATDSRFPPAGWVIAAVKTFLVTGVSGLDARTTLRLRVTSSTPASTGCRVRKAYPIEVRRVVFA
jgi:hypothetical protein